MKQSVWIAYTDGYSYSYKGTGGRVYSDKAPEALKIQGVYSSELLCLRDCVNHNNWKCKELEVISE